MISRLIIFISSTSDLEAERDVVESALAGLDVDDSRFESWPSSPNDSVSECLRRIEESDALILLLGNRYGCLVPGEDISFSHMEYRHAKELGRPIFFYLLERDEHEPEQDRFIEEVQRDYFRCAPVEDHEQLRNNVHHSLLEEFTRCFREVHQPPATVPVATSQIEDPEPPKDEEIPSDPTELKELLETLYKLDADFKTHYLADVVEERLGDDPVAMNYVFMAQVNLAMKRGLQGPVDRSRLIKAFEFWGSESARNLFSSFTLLYNRGNVLDALGRYPEAINEYKQSIEENPNFAQCWKNLGNCYYKLKQEKLAFESFERALTLNPLLSEALYSFGTHALKHENDPQKALTYFNRIIVEQTQDHMLPLLYGWKANALLQLGRYAEGIACAESALTLDSEPEWAWSVAARLYALIRREDRGWVEITALFWKRYLEWQPYNASAWAELGFSLWFMDLDRNKTQVLPRAANAFQKALELGYEDDGLLWDRIGHIHEKFEDWEAAEQPYRKAVEKNPARFGYCLGVNLISQERFEEALPWVKAAAEKHQPDAKSWCQVAFCLEALGDLGGAIQSYGRATELDKEYPEAWFNLGGVLWNSGKIEEAETVWTEALSKFPDHLLAVQAREFFRVSKGWSAYFSRRAELAELLASSGEHEESWKTLEEAFDMLDLKMGCDLSNCGFSLNQCILALSSLPYYKSYREMVPAEAYWLPESLYDGSELTSKAKDVDFAGIFTVTSAIPFGLGYAELSSVPKDQRDRKAIWQMYDTVLNPMLTSVSVVAREAIRKIMPTELLADPKKESERIAEVLSPILTTFPTLTLLEFSRQTGYIAGHLGLCKEDLDYVAENHLAPDVIMKELFGPMLKEINSITGIFPEE